MPRRSRDSRPPPKPVASSCRPQPALFVADDSDDDGSSRPTRTVSSSQERVSQTFGQRARDAASASASKKKSNEAEEEWNPYEIVRGAPGGGMEMSFIPAVRDKASEKSADKEEKKTKKAKEQYGAGLENRGDMADDAAELEGEEDSGRQKMRKGVRSASRTVVRQLQ